jgi:hypothetical protein
MLKIISLCGLFRRNMLGIMLCSLASMITPLAHAAHVQDKRAARVADVSTIDGLLRAYYEVVFGAPGVACDMQWDLSPPS